MLKNIIRIHFWITIVGIISHVNQPVYSDSIVDNRHTISSYRDKIIGCLYEDVCSEGEICFDDNVFGRCEQYDQQTGSITSDYVYQLDRKTAQLLEQEINRLSASGYDWIHPYTQCVLKVILNDRPRVVYDSSRCDKLLIPYILTKPSMVKPTLINDNWLTENNNENNNNNNEKDNDNSINKIFLQPSVKIDVSKINLARKNLDKKYHKNNLNKESLPFISTLSSAESDKTSTSVSRTKTEKNRMKNNDQDNIESIFIDKQYNLQSKQRNPTIKIKDNDDSDQRNEHWKKSSINNGGKWQTNENEHDTEDNDDFNAEHNKKLINYLKLMIDNNNDETNQNEDPDWLNSFMNGYRELLDVPSNDNSMEEYYIHSNRYSGNQMPTLFKMPEVRVIRDTESEDEDDDDNDRIDLARMIDTPTNDNVLWFDLDNEEDDDNHEDIDYRTYADDVLRDLLEDKMANVEPFISEPINDEDDKENEDNFDQDDNNDKTVNYEKEILLDPINYDDYLLPNFNRNQRYDIKKPGPIYMEDYFFKSTKNDKSSQSNQSAKKSTINNSKKELKNNRNKNPQTMKKDFSLKASQPVAEGPVKLDVKAKNTLIVRTANNGERTNLEAIDSSHTYVITDRMLGEEESEKFLQTIEQVFNLPRGTFSNLRKNNYQITFKVNPNYLELNASQVASRIEDSAELIKEITGFTVKETGIGDKTKLPVVSPLIMKRSNERLIRITFLVCTIIISIITAAFTIFIFHRNGKFREKIKGFMKMSEEWIRFDYQDLCRQKFKSKNNFNDNGKEEKADLMAAEKEVSVAGTKQEYAAKIAEKTSSSAGNDGQGTPPSRGSSTSSWIEEPIASNMDITTGHIILSYMEDHLKNKNRLDREWEALCAYEADPCSTNAASQKQNQNKNRYPTLVPYDHSRVILNDFANVTNSDYINANTISDHDPRNPAYIATQGPLPNTKADFWQMIWEQGSVLIIMLTRLRENGLNMCERYWPEEGSEMFQNYEVHLVSEHIWCDDYLVRSFYLKNLKTGETRTVTQFHFLSWPENGVPANIKSVLDFRRKVNKSYKGRACPMVVHCSDGVGRTGTYILIDMVLNRLAKGAKEIDIAASLEHIRDQRSGMVNTKAQFEFVLLSVADEVQSILKALSQ